MVTIIIMATIMFITDIGIGIHVTTTIECITILIGYITIVYITTRYIITILIITIGGIDGKMDVTVRPYLSQS